MLPSTSSMSEAADHISRCSTSLSSIDQVLFLFTKKKKKKKKNHGNALSHWKLNFINSTDSQCRFPGLYSQNSDSSDLEVAQEQVFLQTSRLFLTSQVVLVVKTLLPMPEMQEK